MTIHKNLAIVSLVNIDNKIFLALDTSYEQGAVALFSGDNILLERILAQKFAHGKMLCDAIEEALAMHDHIDGVFCGLGPGSFVGVRIALATALGFCFGRNISLMGFCSHEALAFTSGVHEDAAIYMKASGDLGYLSKLSSSTITSPTEVVNIDELAQKLAANTLIISDQSDLIANKFPSHFRTKKITGPSPAGIVDAARARLKREGVLLDERAFIKPNYVKPPSVSVPKHKA